MKLLRQLLFTLPALGLLACSKDMPGDDPSARLAPGSRGPNFLLVVVDDMGFSDIEPFGGEIETPTLNQLADKGVILTNFYAAPTCSPARAMLMSGRDNHIAGLGNMAETVADNQMGLPGYEGHLRAEVPTIAERLSQHGYRTVMAGKWHLGMKRELSPGARGFDHALSFSFGGGSHFSDLM
ncbi:MAG: sulfatase-like hydrolase/transferase, partial [Pseudomonadota bacterium]